MLMFVGCGLELRSSMPRSATLCPAILCYGTIDMKCYTNRCCVIFVGAMIDRGFDREQLNRSCWPLCEVPMYEERPPGGKCG